LGRWTPLPQTLSPLGASRLDSMVPLTLSYPHPETNGMDKALIQSML